jgi:hypothetical protein
MTDPITTYEYHEPPGQRLFRHLLQIVTHVLKQGSGLLHPQERRDLEGILALPAEAGVLLCRLLDRKQAWLLQSSLRYDEIPDFPRALLPLLDQGWVQAWPPHHSETHSNGRTIPSDPPQLPTVELAEDLVRGLDLRQSRSLLQRLGQPSKGNLPQLHSRLHTFLTCEKDPPSPQIPDDANNSTQGDFWPEKKTPLDLLLSYGPWLQLIDRPLIPLCELLFFGSTQQTRKTLLLEEIGIHHFVDLGTEHCLPFSSREEVDLLLWASNLQSELDEKAQDIYLKLRHWKSSGTLNPSMKRELRQFYKTCWETAQTLLVEVDKEESKMWFTRGELLRLATRLLCLGASLLERVGRHQAALRWQAVILEAGDPVSRSRAMRRTLINLKHVKQPKTAMALRSKWLLESHDPLLSYDLGQGPPSNVSVEHLKAQRHLGWRQGKALVEGKAGAALWVEDFALEHFASQGWCGLHLENNLIRALVGLVFWDVLFAKEAGGFLHSWQGYPLDWREEGFLERRIAPFQEVIQNWPSNRQSALDRITTKNGIANPLINWTAFERWPSLIQALEVLTDTLSAEVVADLGTLILGNPRRLGKGMPDLFLWKNCEQKQNEQKHCEQKHNQQKHNELIFVEIKGTGDSLSPQQEFWLQHLSDLGFNTQILHIDH